MSVQFNRLNARPTASDWTKRVRCCERERKWFSVRSFCVNKQTIIIYCVWTLTSSNESTKHHDTRHCDSLLNSPRVRFANAHTHSQCMLCKVHIRWWWWGDTAIRQKSSLNVEEEEEAKKNSIHLISHFWRVDVIFVLFVRSIHSGQLASFLFRFFFLLSRIFEWVAFQLQIFIAKNSEFIVQTASPHFNHKIEREKRKH